VGELCKDTGQTDEDTKGGQDAAPGYWQKPVESAAALQDGELRTGDVGFMDERGWFYLVGRSKDMIVASGYKVWPREVEEVLYLHPAVREAAVVGVPDPYRGETVKAVISLKHGHTVTPEEIIEFAKQQMAAYKYPRTVEIMDDLPKTTSGKILRRLLVPAAPAAPEVAEPAHVQIRRDAKVALFRSVV
jgi:long-chain acyl-CoA synthetase